MVKGVGPQAHLRSRCVRTQRGHHGAESWNLPGSSEGPPCRHSQGDVGAAVLDQSSRRPPGATVARLCAPRPQGLGPGTGLGAWGLSCPWAGTPRSPVPAPPRDRGRVRATGPRWGKGSGTVSILPGLHTPPGRQGPGWPALCQHWPEAQGHPSTHFQPRAQRAQSGRVRVSGCTNTRAGGVGGPGRLRVCVHMPPSHRRA